MTFNVHDEIRQAIKASSKVLVVSHVRPDGDAVGALLAIGLGITNLGKEVHMVLSDGVPGSFRHLPGAEKVTKANSGDYNLTILVDCSDLKRAGSALSGYPVPDINIDHHKTNDNIGRINLVKAKATATSEIIAEHMESWGLTIDKDIANALLAGIVADTLGFRTSNITPDAMRLSASLMEKGADLPEQYSRALLRRSFSAASYWGAGLSHLQQDNGMVWGTLTLADRKASAYPGNDDADLINVISAIDGFEIAMIFVEQHTHTVKISWRSINHDVSKIALQFGGGGHAAAAGADVPGTLEDIQAQVLSATKQVIDSSRERG
jgi:phosphoesterase RecJ-like protein